MLSKARRYMIVINLILGAVLTTPEVDHATRHVRAAAIALRNHRLDRVVLGPADGTETRWLLLIVREWRIAWLAEMAASTSLCKH